MYYKWRGFLLAFLFPIIVSANTDGPVKLGGRLFIDGGLFTKNSYSAHAKAEITDVRLTGKITLPDEPLHIILCVFGKNSDSFIIHAIIYHKFYGAWIFFYVSSWI